MPSETLAMQFTLLHIAMIIDRTLMAAAVLMEQLEIGVNFYLAGASMIP